MCDIIEKNNVPPKHKICDAKVIEKKLITSKEGENLGISLTLKAKDDEIFSTFNAYKSKYNNTDFDEFIKSIDLQVEVYIKNSYVAAVRIDKVA